MLLSHRSDHTKLCETKNGVGEKKEKERRQKYIYIYIAWKCIAILK